MYNGSEMCYKLSNVKSDAVLNMRVPSDVKEALSRAAEDNLRTMSSMATWALAEWLTEHGYLDRTATAVHHPSSRTRRK
jgi:hypothetical protein